MNIIDCKKFQMYSSSISMLFGKSPKIHYICGNCDGYNATRIPTRAIELEKPYTRCKYCGTINNIPITFDEYYFYDN